MLTPPQIVETYFLESRYMLLEIAAYLDRYDAAVNRDQADNSIGNGSGQATGAEDKKLALIRRAMTMLVEPKPQQERTRALLALFAPQ